MKKKFYSAMMAVSMMFLGMTCLTVNAEEPRTESQEEGLLNDVIGSIVVSESPDKGVMPETIDVEAAPNLDIVTYSVDNTDIDHSELISVNSLSYDMIAEKNQQRWYYFWSDAGKLTVDLTTPESENVDYDLYLYRYSEDEGGTAYNINFSQNDGTSNEHIAMMVDSGVYFVAVNGYSGYDADHSFRLGIGYSDTYDSSEIDDDFSTAKVVSIPFSVTGTIDNAYDNDYVKFTVTEAGAVTLLVSDNNSSSNDYRLELYNGSGKGLGYLPEGRAAAASLTAGNYYVRVLASSYAGDNTSTYTLSGSFAKSAASVNITKAGDAFINYGQGNFWRIDGSAVVTGTAYDANGKPMANTNIEIRVAAVKNNETISASGTTDSNGNFSIKLVIGNGVGQYMYDSGVSYHHYDVVPIYFYSNNVQIKSNISYIYHFAYQVMHNF